MNYDFDRERHIEESLEAQDICDNCQVCGGAKGGVRGNENIIDGVVMCDYCDAGFAGKGKLMIEAAYQIEHLTKALEAIAALPIGHHDAKKIAKEALLSAPTPAPRKSVSLDLEEYQTGVPTPAEKRLNDSIEDLEAREYCHSYEPSQQVKMRNIEKELSRALLNDVANEQGQTEVDEHGDNIFTELLIRLIQQNFIPRDNG